MGVISAITGNAGEVNVKKFAAEFEPILAPGEELLRAYQVIRDTFVFTNKRLILVDVQGGTGSKAEYMTIPFSSILRFWKDKHVNEIYRILSMAVRE
jgi:hypothetical protein